MYERSAAAQLHRNSARPDDGRCHRRGRRPHRRCERRVRALPATLLAGPRIRCAPPQRRVILAGGGARGAAARAASARRTARRPVIMTINARGLLPPDHPLAVPMSPSLEAVRAMMRRRRRDPRRGHGARAHRLRHVRDRRISPAAQPDSHRHRRRAARAQCARAPRRCTRTRHPRSRGCWRRT